MATLCFVIGAIMLLGCAGGGYLIGAYLLTQDVIVNLLSLNGSIRFLLMGCGAVIGLLFAVNWVVLGLNCRAIRKLKRRRKKREV